MNAPKTISIFGATGSVGLNTVDLIKAHPGKFKVQVLSGHSNFKKLAEIAKEVGAETVVISDETHFQDLKALLDGEGIEVEGGRQALLDAACQPVDLNVMAIVGIAGLEPLFTAIPHSKYIAIANKEPLVAAGDLLMNRAEECGAKLLPLDSEHNAIFQVFESHNKEAIERLILTASGGPFLDWSIEDMKDATVEQALKHPNWEMGHKISIDSATMMNKALEVIEAHYLFDMPQDKIDVVIHPQSIVHSMVEYSDGSILSQMGASDMRTPIAYALGWPERIGTSGEKLDFLKQSHTLEFYAPDTEKFPALPCAYQALKEGQAACITLNATNEVAVEAFLMKEIGFLDIIKCTQEMMARINYDKISDLESVIDFDQTVRAQTKTYINEAL